MKVPDSTPATVDVSYSNIGEEWCAQLLDENGKPLASAYGATRAGALYNLAEEIEDA